MLIRQIPAPDQGVLLVALGTQTQVLLLRVVTHPRPGARHMVQLCALGEADPEVRVHGQVPPRIQAAHLLVDAAAPERGRLRKVIMIIHPDKAVKWDLLLEPDGTTIGVYPEAVTVDNLPVGVLGEDLGYLAQGTGFEEVVGAQPA